MKKTDNTRSHSWWWDSHISPKNSKWLQDNLAEMDTKVSAMLKIIEEDADSFAQKAEMYYKKRPELINLIEEFYRTYRALVERYNFLTKEIRLNIAPALQAQLGVSSESPQNSPVDIHLKRGIDAPDIISPSYSYAGVSEFDADSPSSMKGQTDDETSPLGQNYERRTFGFRARSSAFDDTPRKLNGSESVNGKTDVEISQLQKEVLRLQEENKTLASRASQDVSKLKELQLQLSTLQSRARSLEEEDKLGKRRLKAVQEKEQKLEAENLKLSHSLISLKEEKSQLLEQQKKMVEDSETAHQKIKHLEDQNIDLKAELLDVQSKHSENCESLEKSESFLQELRCLIANLQEEKLKDSVLINVLHEENEEMLKKVVDFEKSSAETLEQVLAQQTEACILQAQLTDVLKVKQTLEQVLEAMTQNKVSAEKERSLALARVEDLQKEVEEIQKNRQQEAENISKLNELIVVLEKEGRRAQSEILESSKRVHELETIIQEGQISKETLLANCQQHEDNCKVLELKYAESSEKLFSTSQEVSRLDQQIQSLKDMITTLQAQQGELEQNNSSLLKENKSLVEELQIAVERSKSAEKEHVALQVVINNRDKEIEMFQQELSKLQDEVKKLEDELVCLSKEKAAVTEQESQTLLAYYKLENEHGNLKQKMESEGALIEGLKGELSCLNLEKSELLCRSEQTEQKLLELQKANAVLSSQCLENEKNLQAAEEATKRVQEELALSLMKVSSLQEGIHAKDELLREKVSGIEMLQAHLAQSKEESGSFRQQLDVSNEKVMLLETSNNDLLSKLSELESVHRALSEKVSEREEKLEHVIHELAASQKQLELQQAILLEGSLMKETLEDSIRRLQQEISELKEVNQSLRDGHQKLLDEILLLKTSNHDLEADLEAAEKESRMLKGKLISSHEDVVAKSNQCNELTLKVSNLEAELDTAQEGHETLKMQLARAEIELMDSARKCYDSERRVQDLELSLSDLLAEKTGLTEQLNEMTQSVHTLKSTVIDLEKGNSALNDEKDLLSQQVSAFRIQEASLLNEMQQHTNTIHDLRTQIEGLKQDVLNSQEAEKRISLEHRKGLDECQSLQQKLQDLREDLNTRQEEKTTYLRDIDVHIGRSNELCSEVRRLESDKDCLQLKLSDLLAERVSLTKQLKERIESVHALEVAVGNSKKEITALEEDKAHLEQQVSTYKLQEACFLDEMQKSSEVLRDLRSEMERVKQELLNAQQNETKLYLQQKKSNDECQSFQQTVKDLQRDLSCCLEEKDLLLKNIESHSAKCNELSSEIKRLEAETDSTKLRLSESLDEKASLMEQLREKTERAQMFEMALLNLKKENATLNEEMGLLQQRTSAFRTEMGLLQQQASVFKTQEASLLAELHESSGIIQDLRSEIEGLKQEQRKSLEQCQSFQQNIKVLQHDLNSCLDEKALLLKTIDNHLANCNELSSEVRRLEAETDRVKLRLSESLDEKTSLMEQLKEKTECAQMFEMTLLNLKKDNSSLNEKMGLLQQQASAFKTQEASLLTELHESSDIIQGLRSEIEGLQQELLNAQEKEKRISLEQRKSVEECQSLQQNMKDLQRDLSRCLDEKALFVKTIDSHLENCNVLSSEVRRLEAETDCIKLRLSESSDEKASLMEQLKKKTETVQELESALHNLQKENTKLNDEMGLLQQQASAFRIQEASFLAESCKSSDIIQDLRSEMDGLKQELLNARENEKRVLLEKRKCIVECQSFQQVIKDLQCDLNNYAEEKTQFLKSIDSHLARCNELSSEVRRLESETDCLKLRLSELLDEKTLSMEQLREKTETIQDFEIALFNLKKDNATLNEEKGFLQEQVSAFKTQETSLLTELHKSSDIIQDLRSEMEGLRQALLKAQENEKIIFLEQRKSLEECNSFQQTINCLQQDLSICLEEKTSALRDVASHLGRSSELDFEVRRLEADKGTLELKLSEILTEKTSLSEQLTMKVESVNSLETTISDLKKENAILNQELHMLQQKISAFRTQEVSFINEMQRSSGMIHDLKSVMEGLKQEILDAQESEKRVSLEHRKSLDECELLQQTIKDLQRDLDTYNEEKALLLNDVANHSKRSRELDSEMRRLETEKSCLQEELFRAQNIEHELRDEVNRLQKEREQLSVACNSLKDVNVKQEKDLQGLHQVIMRSKEEYQFEIHKMSLISEEKTLLLQDLKESQKELNKARGDCFKLQTDLDQLQQAVMIIETDMKKSVDELAVMKEHILVLQHVNADLERELELSTRQAVQKELEGMMLDEILAAAQDENVILEKHLTDMQIRAVENDHKSNKHQKDIEALQEELASAHFSRRELEQRLAHVQIESASSCNKIEEMRKEISELQARNGKLDADLQSVIVEGHENMVKLLSLQEELVCAGRLKLELSAKLSELTDEWDVTERRLQEDILQLKRDVDFHSASASKQENELRLLLEQKEALEAEKASMGKEAFELKQQIAESKSHLAMKDDNLSAKENLLLELQKQVQVYNEKNKDLVESLQELDTELAQSKNLDNMISENLENKCLSYDTTNNQGVSFMSLEASKHDEVSRFGDDHLKIINNVKEKLLILLKENHNAKAVSLTKQQEQISDLQEEILHLNSELKLYKQGVFLLKKIIHGEDFQEKAEDKIAHEDAKALQVMLDSLRNTFVTLKLKVNELKEEAERELIQKRQLQAILIHCQTKGVALTSVLKNNFLLFCKGLKTMMSEFNRVACSNDSTFVVIDSLEILSRLEVLCSISDIQDQHNVSEANGTCLESDSQLPNSSSFLLGQLQKRVEESKLFVEAIKVMLPSKDECKDMTTSPINISNQITDSSSVEEMKNSLQHDQHLMLPAEHKESNILSSAEMADFIIKEISEEVRNEERDSIEGASLDQEQERDLIGGLAQLHINLGMRLQQALLDEKLESELQELKEERKKLKDGLDARVQQVQNMEMELEKLHIILKGGKEGIVDLRQQQLHIRHKKKAEKRARRLSSELVIQRQHVGRLQDAVATWTAQQELATEMLEEQVTTLVSNECTPNMDGWDASQVTQLLQEMQSRRALTKRHSMDLESVGHDLERVGSSIESTQRLLMEKVEGRENEDDDEIDRKTFPAKIASGTKSQGKLSRFGLTWLLLFFSTQRALFRRSASSTASVAPPRTAQRNSEVAGNALTSLVPQTRRMSCCACIMSSGRPHHLMALNEK